MKRNNMQVICLCLLCIAIFFGTRGIQTAKAEETISLTLNRTTLLMKKGTTNTLTVKKMVLATGSAIFLHCQKRIESTSGCISVSKANMKKILRNLSKGAKIAIYPENK